MCNYGNWVELLFEGHFNAVYFFYLKAVGLLHFFLALAF